MQINVTLPNGSTVTVENDLSTEEIREVVAAAGAADVANARAVEGQDSNGNRTVAFQPPQGSRKG